MTASFANIFGHANRGLFDVSHMGQLLFTGEVLQTN